MLGVLFALLSTASFSMNAILVRRGVAKASASAGAFVTVLIGVPLFLIGALVTGQIVNVLDIDGIGYLLLGSAGVIHFVVGRYFNYRAISAIGAARSGPIQTLTIPYSILVAFFTLGEGITVGQGFAIALIMVGPAIMVERRAGAKKPAPAAAPAGGSGEQAHPHFEMRQLEGYVTAMLAAVGYGTSPILIRAALEDATGVSVLGGLIAYTAASLVLLASLIIPGRRNLISAMNLSTVRLFFGAGFFVFLAQMFRFTALSMAPVAIVTPLQRSGTLFTLVLSWAMNRHLENITGRVVLGVVVSVAGAVLLVVAR